MLHYSTAVFRKGMACSCSLKSHPGAVDVNVEALLCLVGPQAQVSSFIDLHIYKALNFPKPLNSLLDTDINRCFITKISMYRPLLKKSQPSVLLHLSE